MKLKPLAGASVFCAALFFQMAVKPIEPAQPLPPPPPLEVLKQHAYDAAAASTPEGMTQLEWLRFVLAVIQQESAWNPRAESHAGAIGLMQLMPWLFKSHGIDGFDPVQNLRVGTSLLANYYRANAHKGKEQALKCALANYNAGPGAVAKYGCAVPYVETIGYVSHIMETYANEQL